MKVAQYVADFVASLAPSGGQKNVYAVCGAGAMYLNDAICHHDGIRVIPMHHEQAAAFAAEGEARVTNEVGIVHVTAGPGGTNALTGIACAYVDSIPMLVIAGQVTSTTMARSPGLRQLGMNELDMVAIAGPVTKYARTLTEPFMVRYALEKALYAATTGRKGPAWLEIPLDIQAAEIDPDRLIGFDPAAEGVAVDNTAYVAARAEAAAAMLARAERPVLIIGNGVRLASACTELRALVDELQIPVISSWTGIDIVDNRSPWYLGRIGLFGDRPSNLAVQNADLVLAIGTRLSVGQIGHAPEKFAPKARKIVVDIDSEEINRPGIKVDLSVIADAREFLMAFRRAAVPPDVKRWWYRLAEMTEVHGFSGVRGFARNVSRETGVDSYQFVKELERHLRPDAIVVTDVGFSFIPVMQTMSVKPSQRLFHSCGVSPMGWAIAAAIGACLAASGRQVVCIVGDGGAMMNLQELQTIAALRLPITIFVIANGGYATMRITQQNHFGRDAVSGPASGLTVPDFGEVACAFGISAMRISGADAVGFVLDAGARAPNLVVCEMQPDQVLSPRVQARVEDGKFVPTDICDMWPHLPRDEFAALNDFDHPAMAEAGPQK